MTAGVVVRVADRVTPPRSESGNPGARSNTREQRIFDTWDAERREVVQEALGCDPLYKPPHGHRPLVKELRLYIPVKENPGYNFIGGAVQAESS
jgi:splicing factor 1